MKKNLLRNLDKSIKKKQSIMLRMLTKIWNNMIELKAETHTAPQSSIPRLESHMKRLTKIINLTIVEKITEFSNCQMWRWQKILRKERSISILERVKRICKILTKTEIKLIRSPKGDRCKGNSLRLNLRWIYRKWSCLEGFVLKATELLRVDNQDREKKIWVDPH